MRAALTSFAIMRALCFIVNRCMGSLLAFIHLRPRAVPTHVFFLLLPLVPDRDPLGVAASHSATPLEPSAFLPAGL